MNTHNPIPLTGNLSVNKSRRIDGRIMLVKPPYFTPWTPPLGIAILKSFLAEHGFSANCSDFNIDPELWGMHHKYFATLQSLDGVSINDGYSKLWWILDAHMLAFANEARPSECAMVLEAITPLYGIRCDRDTVNALIALVEGFFKRLGDLTDQVNWSEFSVVGTSTYSTSLSSSLFILKRVKEKYPRVITVMGGGVFADDLALGSDNLTTLIDNYPYVDHAILGEGELLLLNLLEGKFDGKKVITISDLNGTTLKMNEVPIPDFSDLNNELYYHLSIEGARSCPFQCSFCSETIQWGEYRKKPTAQFVDQVVNLAQRYNNNTFFMGDSLMNPYINPFADELIKKQANVLYDGYLRADKPVTNRGFVKLWTKSGLFRVRLGIESAAIRILDAMDKKTTPKVISDVLKTLASEGVRTTTYWIVGFPGETEEDFQQTCDFIREHHRDIYELEAHPYCYYPYGQVGSRLYESRSLYPDEVTRIINFRVWDIADADPSREQRYDRLRRISKLASDLGLPNIYTMSERYEAEERWQLLHPLAAEVYEGSRPAKKEIHLPDSPLAAPHGSFKRQLMRRADPGSVYCYQVTVNDKLDARLLSACIRELISNVEVLQIDLRDGQYVLGSDEEKIEEAGFVAVYDCEGRAEEVKALKAQIIEKLSSEMRPERAASIKAALINRGELSCELLLLVHKALVDAKSVALLLEELYRAYTQLSNGRPVYFWPPKRTYTELLKELQADTRPNSRSGAQVVASDEIPADKPKRDGLGSLTSIEIAEPLTARLTSHTKGDNLGLREIIATALARSLAKSSVRPAMDITVDWRIKDADSERTVGDFIIGEALPVSTLRTKTLKADLAAIGDALRRIPTEGSGLSSESNGRVLLNLDYIIEKPWLDHPSWIAEGFNAPAGCLDGDYLLEAVPMPSEDVIEVHLLLRDEKDATKLADDIARHLPAEIEAILAYYERFNLAKYYWLNEFRDGVPEVKIGITGRDGASASDALNFVKCEVESAVLQDARLHCGADLTAVLLAGFWVMISHLSGSQDLVVVACIDKYDGVKVAPIRVRTSWGSKFTDIVREVEIKLASGIEHEEAALDVITEYLPGSNEGSTPPVFSIGYLSCREPSEADAPTMRAWLKMCAGAEREFELILRVVEEPDGVSLYLLYPGGEVEREVIKKQASYLSTILREVSANPECIAGEIGVVKYASQYAVALNLNDNFDF